MKHLLMLAALFALAAEARAQSATDERLARVVAILERMDERLDRLEQRVAALERRETRAQPQDRFGSGTPMGTASTPSPSYGSSTARPSGHGSYASLDNSTVGRMNNTARSVTALGGDLAARNAGVVQHGVVLAEMARMKWNWNRYPASPAYRQAWVDHANAVLGQLSAHGWPPYQVGVQQGQPVFTPLATDDTYLARR